MKNKFFFLFTLIIFKVTIGFGQLQQLMSLNYQNYVGKPVDSLVNALPAGYTNLKVISGSDVGQASDLQVSYPNNIRLYINVVKFKYLNPNKFLPGPTLNTWDVNLFKKETIASSTLYDSSGCKLGCENICLGCP